jgi:hypothetical protein
MLLLDWHFFDGDGVTGERIIVKMKMANIIEKDAFMVSIKYE